MKKITLVFSLLVLLVSTGIASAREVVVVRPLPGVAVVASLPGVRFIYGRPGVYCWYQGHYYSRADWDRYYHRHADRFAYRDQRDHRDNRDSRDNRGHQDDQGHRDYQGFSDHQDHGRF